MVLRHWLLTSTTSNNKISDDGAKALASQLKHCTQLNMLAIDLSNNNISDDGAKALNCC